jgi:hypothetical protein
MKLMDVRNSKPLLMTFMIQDNSAQITISSDSMELCGDLAQDLFVTNLKQVEVETQDCRFPDEMTRLGELLAQIEQHNQLKTHFSANIAESINNLKVFIVKAEASLMINDM